MIRFGFRLLIPVTPLAVIAVAVSIFCSAESRGQTAADNNRAVPLPKHILAGLGERVAAMEERVLGLEHPLDSLLDRVDVLERETYGSPHKIDPAGHTLALPERISALEKSVYPKTAKSRENLPDGMSTFVDDKLQSVAQYKHSGKLRVHSAILGTLIH